MGKRNSKEFNEAEKKVLHDAKMITAGQTGKQPSDVVVEVTRVQGSPELSKYRSKGGKTARRSRGQQYSPTADDFQKVEEMTLIGLDQHTIAKIMGVSNATLLKYYRGHLTLAREKRTARVAGVAYEMAISGEDATMTKFWLGTQAGWTKKEHIITEDRSFDISWSDNEEDIADANNRLEDATQSKH